MDRIRNYIFQIFFIGIYCFFNVQFIKYNTLSFAIYLPVSIIYSLARIYVCDYHIILSQITKLQILMVAITWLLGFTIHTMIILGVICVAVYYYDSFTNDDELMIGSLFAVFIFYDDNKIYQLWFFLLRTFIVYRGGDAGNMFSSSLYLFLLLSFQSNLLFLLSILNTIGIICIYRRKYFCIEKKVNIIQFTKMMFVYGVMLCIYSFVFLIDDIFTLIFHVICVWAILMNYWGLLKLGVFFFLEWCHKMNFQPYMVLPSRNVTYHIKLSLSSFLFTWANNRKIYVEDLNKKSYANLAKRNDGVMEEMVTDDMINEKIRSICFYPEEDTIGIEENYEPDITNIFYEKVMHSNTSITLKYFGSDYRKITILADNVTMIDIYHLIKRIVNKFCTYDDIATIILKFFMKKNYQEATKGAIDLSQTDD